MSQITDFSSENTHIICIAQITFKEINNTLLIHKAWFRFCSCEILGTTFLLVYRWAVVSLSNLGKTIGWKIQPVYISRKIAADFPAAETKPPLVNQQCVVYLFKCDVCDADYVGYTCRHLHQRTDKNTHILDIWAYFTLATEHRNNHKMFFRLLAGKEFYSTCLSKLPLNCE